MPIINSLMDTDWYKYTMAQFVLHNHPGAMVKYKYRCRNGKGTPFTKDFKQATEFVMMMNNEIDHLCTLSHTREEIDFLRTIPYFKPDYIEYLRLLRLNRDYIQCWVDTDCNLHIEIEGPWISTIWFEVPVLAINSELISAMDNDFGVNKIIDGQKNLNEKLNILFDFCVPRGHREAPGKDFKFADFGTRRRDSFGWQREVISRILERIPARNFVGTSNAYFAMAFGIKPIGTMAHEIFQAHQQLGGRLVDHIGACLDGWAREYRGHLGIVLSDIVGFDRFLDDFDLYFAKLFDGCRHDSGDPIWWGEKLINHYIQLGIDPKTKTAVFSDGLNIPKCIELYKTFHNLINVSFGIGTNLTNDVGKEAPQTVIKMVKCNGRPTAKLSDSKGKGMCEDKDFEAYLRHVYNID